MSASEHGGHLSKKVFMIYWKDITPSPEYLKGWRIFKMTAAALGLKRYSQELYSRHLRIVNAVVVWIASGPDRLTEIYFSSN